MTADYRAMCAELLVLAEESPSYRVQAKEAVQLIDRARTLLAQPEPPELTDEELDALERQCWEATGVVNEALQKEELFDYRAFARAAIAQWGRPAPQPPVDGEVAELVEWLRSLRSPMCNGSEWMASRFARAADLLQHQHPQPEPVSERPWEREGWCDEQGQCWLRRKHEEDGVTWRLMAPVSVFDDAMPIYYAEALPANALPLPMPTKKVQAP